MTGRSGQFSSKESTKVGGYGLDVILGQISDSARPEKAFFDEIVILMKGDGRLEFRSDGGSGEDHDACDEYVDSRQNLDLVPNGKNALKERVHVGRLVLSIAEELLVGSIFHMAAPVLRLKNEHAGRSDHEVVDVACKIAMADVMENMEVIGEGFKEVRHHCLARVSCFPVRGIPGLAVEKAVEPRNQSFPNEEGKGAQSGEEAKIESRSLPLAESFKKTKRSEEKRKSEEQKQHRSNRSADVFVLGVSAGISVNVGHGDSCGEEQSGV